MSTRPTPVTLPKTILEGDRETKGFFQNLTRSLYELWTVSGEAKIVDSTPPATASSEGKAGTLTYDADYIYVCVDTDTWKRASLSTW